MNEYSLREDCILNKMIYNCTYNNAIIILNALCWHSLLVVIVVVSVVIIIVNEWIMM